MRDTTPLTIRSRRDHFQPKCILGLTVLTIALLAAAARAPGATVWGGPKMTFTKTAGSDPNLAANQDRITPNVWITRGATQGIYNAAKETLYAQTSARRTPNGLMGRLPTMRA